MCSIMWGAWEVGMAAEQTWLPAASGASHWSRGDHARPGPISSSTNHAHDQLLRTGMGTRSPLPGLQSLIVLAKLLAEGA